VRYTCARDVKENVVVSVKEFPSCNYIVVVSTPFLCKHPAFAPAVSAARLRVCVCSTRLLVRCMQAGVGAACTAP
jgi:hypothetical protein